MRAEFARELVALSRYFGLFGQEVVCCGDVTVSQCVALHLLSVEPMGISAIAEHLAITPGGATRLVDAMEDRGWIERRRDCEDARRVRVHLTEAGREEAELRWHMTEQVADRILEHIPGPDRSEVLRVVGLVRRAVQAAGFEWGACCQAPGEV